MGELMSLRVDNRDPCVCEDAEEVEASRDSLRNEMKCILTSSKGQNDL